MQTLSSEVYLDGLVFGECPRWHGGALWLSDMFGGRVLRSTGPGQAETVLTLPGGRPAGLAYLDDGSLLVVSMLDRKLLRRWPDGRVEPFADLAPHVTGDINDMVRAPDGGVFVGNFGFDLFGGAEGRLTTLHHVDGDGRVREVATDLNFPNGMVVTP
ncbi:MAG TPA: SMP-30/gluconolactonase/LRE family protein, partial [Immundisolibacter sp.]